uniref:Uncharacterized protein n=1 Tax=Romanomermis culicivorax TaxID=13658 RepID=A0A915I9L1_ROMCU
MGLNVKQELFLTNKLSVTVAALINSSSGVEGTLCSPLRVEAVSLRESPLKNGNKGPTVQKYRPDLMDNSVGPTVLKC